MRVRPAREADVGGVRDVAEAAWWETYPGVLETGAIRSALADLYDEAFLRQVVTERSDLLFLVAVDGGSDENDSAGRGENDGEHDDDRSGTDIPGGARGVVGFATAQQTWADEVELHTLYVHPDRWGEGIGTALLEEVEAAAAAEDVARVRAGVLSGNHVGQSFLESRGYERAETVTAHVGGTDHPEDVFERRL